MTAFGMHIEERRSLPASFSAPLWPLEAWLLDMCKESLPVESLLLKILRESNNVNDDCRGGKRV